MKTLAKAWLIFVLLITAAGAGYWINVVPGAGQFVLWATGISVFLTITALSIEKVLE
jgi:hypothetical protein